MCTDTDFVSVTVLAIPISKAGKDTSICLGNKAVLCSKSIGAKSLTWYKIPAWTKIDTATCIPITPPLGINNFALVASNGFCSDTDTVVVTTNPIPMVDAGQNAIIASGQSVVLNGTGTGTYHWTPAKGLSNTTIANPVASPTISTTYTLLVTDPSGCFATDTVRVIFINRVIPNDGISPNGDGKNDVWVIPNIEAFPECVVEVYNRWGQLLFHSIGYKDKWDGTYKEKILPVGSYYYTINLNNALYPDPITGPITIMR